MKKQATPLAILLAGLILLAGCSGRAENSEAASTAAIQTLDAELAIAQAQAAQSTAEAALLTVEAESAAGKATMTAQAAQLTEAAEELAKLEETLDASERVVLRASEEVNCYFGPDLNSTVLTTLAAEQEAVVLARNETGSFWQINPVIAGGAICWVQDSEAITLEGRIETVEVLVGLSPVFTPQPTSTPQTFPTAAPTREPGFAISNQGQNTCSGSTYVVVRVVNTGPETYESARVTITNITTSTELSVTDGNNEFLSSPSSCPKGDSALGPGATAYLVGRLGGAGAGDSIRVHVRLCTEDGFGGNCLNNSFTFTN